MRSTSVDSLWRLWSSAAKQVRLVLGGGNQLEQHHAEREMAMHDLVIGGATVVDGLGHDPIRTDLAVRDGRISLLYRGRRRPTHRRGSPPS
jgi:urease alpha subunit